MSAPRDLGVDVDFSKFSEMVREIRAKLGDSTTLRQVIDFEVGRILSKATTLTTVAKAEKIEHRFWAKRWTTYAGKKYKLSWKLKDATWDTIDQKRTLNLASRLAARGLSAQSWLWLARAAGIDATASATVQNASTKVSHEVDNAKVTRQTTNGNYSIELTNSMPVLRFDPPGGRAALYSAIAGRIGFFKRNVEFGVFNDLATIAKKYPGIMTQQEETPGTPSIDETGA